MDKLEKGVGLLAHIDSIIDQMGYAGSLSLKYKRDDFGGAIFSAHTTKVLYEISPYAVYLVDNNPFIMFFEAN